MLIRFALVDGFLPSPLQQISALGSFTESGLSSSRGRLVFL